MLRSVPAETSKNWRFRYKPVNYPALCFGNFHFYAYLACKIGNKIQNENCFLFIDHYNFKKLTSMLRSVPAETSKNWRFRYKPVNYPVLCFGNFHFYAYLACKIGNKIQNENCFLFIDHYNYKNLTSMLRSVPAETSKNWRFRYKPVNYPALCFGNFHFYAYLACKIGNKIQNENCFLTIFPYLGIFLLGDSYDR
jgi:fatty acid desaturase